MTLRFSSALSAFGKTRRFARDHTRAIAATAAVAGLGAAGAAGAVTATAATAAPPAAAVQMSAASHNIYDSISPSQVPAGQPLATYADGPYAAHQVSGHGKVLWIDTNGSDTKANALDVEPGDATPAGAAQWVSHKLAASPRSTAIVYTMQSEWAQVKAAISTLPSGMQSHVKYWIADPTGTPHMVPGAAATQWYWGSSYDISTAQPGF